MTSKTRKIYRELLDYLGEVYKMLEEVDADDIPNIKYLNGMRDATMNCIYLIEHS